MKSFLKLIRWPNLAIIALSMYLLRSFVILPGLHLRNTGYGMTNLEFILLVFATLCIAIGGYVLNDISDRDIDKLNKPDKNVIGKNISKKTADILYWIFTIAGIVAGSILSLLINQINYSLIFILTAGLLWFYDKRYQCQPLVGNIVVAFLSALSLGLVWLFEFVVVHQNQVLFTVVKPHFIITNYLVLVYLGFAFLVSLSREIIKDIEDYAGDDRFGCRTFAVVYGTGVATTLSAIVLTAGLLFSFWVQYFFFKNELMYLFSGFFIIDFLIVIILFRLSKTSDSKDYSILSVLLKALMLTGILTTVLCYLDLYAK